MATHEYMDAADYPSSEFPKTPPQMDVHSPNITCGRLAFDSAAKTETADVLAGSEVGFRVSWDGNGKYGRFYHPGPGQIYLSKAPNNELETYRGDGDWFKIAYAGPEGNNKWQLWGDGGERDVSYRVSWLNAVERKGLTTGYSSGTSPSPRRRRRAST